MNLDLSPLENAVLQLEEALELSNSELVELDPRLRRHLRAAVIQAFEFTYELSFKMLRRHLEMGFDNPEEIDRMSFSNVIRTAYSLSLVRSELPRWRQFRRNRGTTCHAYSETKAQEVYEAVPAFLEEIHFLLTQLQERNASLE